VPVIASHFIEPDGDPDAFPQLAEFVVKPAVGAGSRDVQRYTAAQRGDAVDHVRRLLRQHRSALVQPYVAGVDAHGESALVFIDGHFSHALRKNALLQPGAAASQALFAPASIGPREATTEELGVARQVLAALPFGPQLYARVDLLPSPAGPLLLELELTEPSLFFVHAPEAATALAHALLARLDAAVRSTGTVVSPAAARPAG